MRSEVVIIGGGIAGISTAYFLARRGVGVTVFEREPEPGYHATSRSAATHLELAADPAIHALQSESGRFFRSAPSQLGVRLLDPTGVLMLYDADDFAKVQAAAPAMRARGTALELVASENIRARFEILAQSPFCGAVWLPACGRIDVPALMQTFLDGARAAGSVIKSSACVTGVLREGDRCIGVRLGDRRVLADVIVNAAGPWAGSLGELAGVPLEMTPLRRTVVCCDPPPGTDVRGWPLISFESRSLYIAPEANHMICCPMDEVPSDPCDARAAAPEIDLALARLADLVPPLANVRMVGSRAGLRTFAPDRRLAIGFDPRLAGFFWLAGQGGWGIETSPALGRLAAAAICGDVAAGLETFDVARLLH